MPEIAHPPLRPAPHRGLHGEHIYPNEEELFAQVNEGDRWQPVALLEELKAKARVVKLWNLFLPESKYGAGRTTLEYAPAMRVHALRDACARSDP